MRILSIIQPSEMGSDFHFDEEAGLWKVNFPAGMGEGGGVPLSTDENNAIVLGSDEGAFISTDLLGAYALTQDNGSKKINLYRFQPGTEFNPETATLVSSVNMIELSGIFDDVAIDGDLITFTDADTGLTLTIDTANLQKVSDIIGTETIEVNSLGGLTTLSVRINPHPDNLIEVTEEGLFVDAANFGEGGGDLDLHQTLAEVENGLCHVVGDSHLVVPQIELTDVAGNSIGYINDIIGLPVSSQTHGPDHCPKWEAPTANNCRVGKVGVALVEDLMYGFNPGDSSIEWRVFFNGVDTGYIASAGEGGDWLEDIISDATGGLVQGAYIDGLTLWNTSAEQVIIKLVPTVPVTLEQLQPDEEGNGIRIFGLDAEQASFISKGQPLPEGLPFPELENLEDYYSAEDSSINICLAPNGSGNGGSTGPQISCAGATDRFATSGLWDKWTVKLNGTTLVLNAYSEDVIQALESNGIRVGYEGEMLTTYRNLTNENIRLEFIAGTPDNYWDQIYLELDNSTNPTLMGYDPIQNNAEVAIQNNAEVAMMAFFPPEEDIAPERYQRITVCLAPFNDWMNWEYQDISTTEALVTLTNSVKLTDAVLSSAFGDGQELTITTEFDKWGDHVWRINADNPLKQEVTLTIAHPDYSDSYVLEYHARKPMIVTLANVHEYSQPFSINSGLEEAAEITAIEVVTKSGSTLISEPEDEMTIDAAVGAIRIDSLENGSFSHIVQGRFIDTGLSDVVKVTFTTTSGERHVVEVNITITNNEIGYTPVSNSQISTVTIGLVDDTDYVDVNTLPIIGIDSPDWSYATLRRINQVGGEVSMNFDFSQRSTYQLHIRAYLGTGFGILAILGDCVIGVDDWGELEAYGYTFNQETYSKRFWVDNEYNIDYQNITKNNLAYVPKESPVGMGDMTGMFAGTDLSDPSVDLSGYDVGNVWNMAGVFAHSNFNGNIVGWNMRWVQRLDYAFYASKFRQDISEWCVLGVTDEPRLFNHRSRLPASFKPVWGTCPVPGSDTTILRHLVRDADPNEDSGLGLFTLTGKNIKVEDVIIKSDGAVIEATKQAGFNHSLGMATVVFQIRTTAGSSGLITIKHPPLHSFHINNQNYTNPKHVDVVKFGKNVKGFRLEMPYAFKVPNSIPNTITTLSRMFEGSTEFTDAENIQQWDVGNVLWMDQAFARCNALNADLRNWCVAKVLTPPTGFADESAILAENFPVWGTCPMGSPYIDSGVEPLAHRVTADSFITTEPMPLLTGRVSHPTAILKVYDDKAIKYTPAVNNGDGTWSCQLDYVKAPTQHRLSVEASSGITNETSGMALMSVVNVEIEGGYWDRETSELVCTAPEGVYLRVINGYNLEFYVSDFQASDGSIKDFTFCVTESDRTMAQFKENGPQLRDPRIEPSPDEPTLYMGTKGDGNGWSYDVMVRNNMRIRVEEYSLSAVPSNYGWSYVNHDTPGMNKAIFMHLKPVSGQTETRIKLVNSFGN